MQKILKLGEDVDKCSKCLIWNFLNRQHSKECAKDNLNTATHPFKLIMESQERKGKEVCNDAANGDSNKIDVLRKLKPCDFTGNSKNAMTNNAFARKEELEDISISKSEHRCPLFATRQRNNFCFSSFADSPMHLIALGLVSATLSIVFQLGSLFNIKKYLTTSVKSIMKALVASRIDFVPIEMSLTDEITR